MTEDEYQRLAQYNSECSHGIVHIPEYEARMAALQAEWDEMQKLPKKRLGRNQHIVVDTS